MQSTMRGVFYFTAFVLLIIGVIDVAQQLKDGEQFNWPLPMIFLGFGAGIPLILVFNPAMFAAHLDSDTTECSGDDGSYGSDGDSGGCD